MDETSQRAILDEKSSSYKIQAELGGLRKEWIGFKIRSEFDGLDEL